MNEEFARTKQNINDMFEKFANKAKKNKTTMKSVVDLPVEANLENFVEIQAHDSSNTGVQKQLMGVETTSTPK